MKKHIIIGCFAVMAVLAGSLDFAEAREHRGHGKHEPQRMEQKFHHKKHDKFRHDPHFMHRPAPHKPAPHLAMRPAPHKPAPFKPHHKPLPPHHIDNGMNLSLRLDNGYIQFGVIN